MQFPLPPPGPVDTPSVTQQMFGFCIAYLLLLAVGLLALPQKLARKVVQIAFHLGSRIVE